MIPFEEAQERVLDSCSPLGTTTLPIERAIGCVLGEDVYSPIDVSPFRNSAMDGFAVRSEWLTGATESNPVRLPIVSTIYAGDTGGAGSNENIQQYEIAAIRIMTGAPLPDNFDSVVKREDVKSNDREAIFVKPITTGENVREAGEDFQKGELVLAAGEIVNRWDVGLFAGIGMPELKVILRPTVIIASTGDELVSPGESLLPGQIYNSNVFAVRALVEQLCRQVDNHAPIEDNESSLRRLFESKQNVIITTGGVSAGDKDLVVKVAEECGFVRCFHKVTIKPGKPIYFARRGKQLLFGLPGNPLSAAVTCALFVLPALKKLAGIKNHRIKRQEARLADGETRKSRRLLIWPGRVTSGNENGKISVAFSPKKSSAALSALKHSDGLIVQSAVSDHEAEPEVSFIPWQQLLTF